MMTKSRLLLFILLGGLSSIAFGQKENNNWVFGFGAGLDFNSGSAVPFKSEISSGYGSGSVSSSTTGKLLFYSDGETVWNRNNQVMPNGTGLLGNNAKETKQGVCIVPVIGDTNKYYLFSLEYQGGTPMFLTNGYLYYSIIDMTLNSGLGDVVTTQKNIAVDSFLGESMIAVPGNHCDDIWLMVHAADTGLVKAYHITAAGINPNPVISYTGKDLDGTGAFGAAGSFAVSPDRTFLAMTSWNVLYYALPFMFNPNSSPNGALICKFDAATGKLSDPVVLNSNLKNPNDNFLNNDICFSPNSKKVYLSRSNRQPGDIDFFDTILQYDVSNFTQAAILNSEMPIKKQALPNIPHAMQRHEDKIYLCQINDYKFYTTLDVINQPDQPGNACDYKSDAITLLPGSTAGYSLPVSVVYPLGVDTAFTQKWDTFFCSGWAAGIPIPAPVSDNRYAYKWDDGTTDSVRKITTEGTYWVQYNNTCHYRVDTFIVAGKDLNVVINVDGFNLSTIETYKTYQWFLNGVSIEGATEKIYIVTENGDYTVVVSDEAGCIDTSDVYEVNNVTGINQFKAMADKIIIYPNPAYDVIYINTPIKVNITLTGIAGRVIRQINNSTLGIPVNELADGVYLLRITDGNGNLIKVEKFVKSGL